MTATSLNENGGATEVDTAVSIDATGSIRLSDTAKDSAAPSNVQRHSLDAVGVGITRFLAAFRESFGTDAEPELTDNVCRECHEYPPAYGGRCMGCNAGRRLPS